MSNERVWEFVWFTLLVALAAGCSDGGGGDNASAAKERDASAASQRDASSGDASASSNPCPSGKLVGSYEIMTGDDPTPITACTEISGDLTVSSDSVVELRFPKLKSVGGALNVQDAKKLASIAFPSLAKIGKELTIDGNPALTTFSLPVLESAQTLLVTNNAKLNDYDLAALTKVDYLGVQGDDTLMMFELPKLKSVSTFVINLNDALTTIRFGSLTIISGDGFIILKNPMLATLDLPMLKTLIGDIAINNNPMLSTCQIDALVRQLDSKITVESIGNDDSATCR
jgi:hypothetical protein